MSLDIVGLHKLIDDWAAKERVKEAPLVGEAVAQTESTLGSVETTAEVKPVSDGKPVFNDKGQAAVRTKTSGDRVYVLDNNTKTRQWVTTPQILEALGFGLNDVNEVDEAEFLKFNMGPALYKMPDAKI